MSANVLPPARPAYVLRGHTAQVQALSFSPDNSRLLTADAEGWIVNWSLAYKRPVLTWRAHKNAVLGVLWWNAETVISHGRDSKLVVWNAIHEDESGRDASLPVEGEADPRKVPPIILELTLNTMNFCSFAWCFDAMSTPALEDVRASILLAVPHTLDSEAIDIFHLPSADRLATISAPKTPPAGMVMALAISSNTTSTMVAAGYESGHVLVYANSSRSHGQPRARPCIFGGEWSRLYLANPHSQPILSLALAPDASYFLTTSADSVVAKHPFRALLDTFQGVEGTVGQAEEEPVRIINTKHSGLQGMSIRNDGKIYATAGWDGRVRVYSTKNGKEIAVLKWHREGCYSTAFAHISGQGFEHTKSENALDEHANRTKGKDILDSNTKVELTADNSAKKQNIVAARRDQRAQSTHWLAAGSKDGKVSLWDVY